MTESFGEQLNGQWRVVAEGVGPTPEVGHKTQFPISPSVAHLDTVSEGLWDQACSDGAFDLARGYSHGITSPISTMVEELLTSTDPADHIADTARAVLETTGSVLSSNEQDLLAMLAAYRKHLNNLSSPLQSDRDAANNSIAIMHRTNRELFDEAMRVLREVHISKQ